MSDLIRNVLSNIIANVIFWFVVGIAFSTLALRKRRRLNRFFGIFSGRSIVVYLASLRIEPGTIKDRDNCPTTHSGIAIPDPEFQTIPLINSLFTSSSIDKIPDFVVGLVDQFWLVKKPQLRFLISPKNVNDLNRDDTKICVGGPKFNFSTDYYFETERPYFRIIKCKCNSEWEVIRGLGHYSVAIPFDKNTEDMGLLLKIKGLTHEETIFITAGISTNGTRAAIHYLVNNWEELYRRFGTHEFGVCLKCANYKNDPEGYKMYTLMHIDPEKIKIQLQ